MCGIAGAFDYSWTPTPPLGREMAIAMVDTLLHRGPDDGGVWIDRGIVLGHRRLSIIDVSPDGHQPMFETSRGCSIVYNGEIYNYRELRNELMAKGHAFTSASDTEVILRGYVEWGQAVIHRVNGMFAWALYDPQAQTLWLARDGIGIKPLFVHDDGTRLWFASEIKALLKVLPHLAKPDREGLSRFLAFGYTPSPRTGFHGIEQLHPGEAWSVRRGHGIKKHRWYRMPYAERSTCQSMQESVHRLELALDSAVSRQLVSDVPVGAMLSGGLDSSAIVRSMSRSGVKIESFAAGFEDPTFDERIYARTVADHFQSTHREINIRDDAHEILPRIVSHAEEPLADNSAIPLFYLCEQMRKFVTVALNGDGADEMLAGYDTYRASELAPRIRRIPGWVRSKLILPCIGILPNSFAKYSTRMMLVRFLEGAQFSAPRDHATWRSMIAPSLQSQMYQKQFQADAGDPWQDYMDVLEEAPDGLSPLQQQLHMDFRFHLPSGLLVKSDRMSMAHGLEVRVPFLDDETVKACLAIPDRFKRIGKDGKRVLKELLAHDLPKKSLYRRKSGFLSPIERWLHAAWQPLLRSQITEAFAEETQMFHWPVLKKMLEEHQTRRVDHAYSLYTLLILSLWWDTWIRQIRKPTIQKPAEARPTQLDSPESSASN